MDEEKRHEMNEDLTYISQKIFLTYTTKIIRLMIIMIIVIYYIGQYWYILVQILCSFQDNGIGMNTGKSDLTTFSQYYSFLNNNDWDLTQDSGS